MEKRRNNSVCVLCDKTVLVGERNNEGQNCFKKFIHLFSNFSTIQPKLGEENIKEFSKELLACEDCFELGKSFCDLYSRWEYLRLQLEWRVREVSELIKYGSQISSGSKVEHVAGLGDSKEASSEIKCLRDLLLLGCKKKLNHALPRIVLQKIQEEEEEDLGMENFSKKCEVLCRTTSSDCYKLQFMLGSLMSFVAVFNLSIPFDSQKSSKSDHQQQTEQIYLGIDKQVQTNCASDEKQAENENVNSNKKKHESSQKIVDSEKNLGKEFTCPKCAKIFDKEIWLNVHIQVHHNFLAYDNEQKTIEEESSPVNDSSNDQEMANDEGVVTATEGILLAQPNPVPSIHLAHQTKAMFECPLCKTKIASAANFRTHMRRVHNTVSGLPGTFQCKKCKEKFTSLQGLNTHQRRIHNVHQPRFKCGKCPQYFETSAKLNTHTYHMHEKNQSQNQQRMKRRRKIPTRQKSTAASSSSFVLPASTSSIRIENLNCPICKVPSQSQKALGSHVRLIHKRILAYQCVGCGTRLKSVEGFRSHMYFIHGKVFETNEALLNPKNLTLGYIDRQGDDEIQHNMSWASIIGSEPESPPSAADINVDGSVASTSKATILPTKNKIGQSKSFHCDFEGCVKQFKQFMHLKRHRRVHTGEKPYQCWWPGCKSKFARCCHRLRHYRRMHSLDKSFPQNSKQLEQRVSTKLMHIKRQRNGLKTPRDGNKNKRPEEAEFMEENQQLKETQELERDTNSNPSWNCGIYQASFCSGEQLTDHMQEEHNQLPLVKFGCTPCAKEFETSEDFEYHMFRAHQKILQKKDASSDENYVQASCSSSLAAQVPVDEDGWKYICPEVRCNESFLTQQEMISHLNTHAIMTGEGEGGSNMMQGETMERYQSSPPVITESMPDFPLLVSSPQIGYGEEVEGFMCAHCCFETGDETELQIHFETYHQQLLSDMETTASS